MEPPNPYAGLSPLSLLAVVANYQARIAVVDGRLLIEATKLPLDLIEAIGQHERRIRTALALRAHERPSSCPAAGGEV